MRAFEIHLNGKRLCTAGIDGDGVLTAMIRSVRGQARSREDLALDIGGQLSETDERVRWEAPRLQPGDEIYLRVVDVNTVDRPARRSVQAGSPKRSS